MNLAEIVLPHGTQIVTVGDIPGLIALAIHPPVPDDSVRTASSLRKQPKNNPDMRPVSLTEDDWVLLHRIWGDLPPYRDGLAEGEVHQYIEAARHTDIDFGWVLVPIWRDDDLISGIAQVAAEREHFRAIEEAVRSGALVVRSRLTLLPQSSPFGEQLKRAVMTVEDLEHYAAGFRVGVRIAEEAPLALPREQHVAVVRMAAEVGLTRQQILALDWPLPGPFKQESLGRALSDVPKWLSPARLSVGKPGKISSTWNPALLAVCLVDSSRARMQPMRVFLQNNFPDYFEQWEEYVSRR